MTHSHSPLLSGHRFEAAIRDDRPAPEPCIKCFDEHVARDHAPNGMRLELVGDSLPTRAQAAQLAMGVRGSFVVRNVDGFFVARYVEDRWADDECDGLLPADMEGSNG